MQFQTDERFTYQDLEQNRIIQGHGFQGQPLQEDMISMQEEMINTFSSPNSDDLHYTIQVNKSD